ncbi:tRNA (adenosine(37)-N6)-threonylcarbamoyltransferase complex dimerization subunit type 1 TsaB [Methylobacillus flagellatus]|uniref:tRNA (adenosine(37)-N6)-threonylcarbamoyltransferase complex dimerization subunit type 1 TsaB n=1 Tax=Methylobacillus flagellatus TaxID=405 RepID=UPI0010F6DE3C|nr:tRNA (adenosine(37)-N6)-threonylcarbamoyltransferase complex dimerization subunit type 1 TsaB [Methylobacillus flagellatus]
MRLLAFDTSTEYLSLALWLDGRVLVRDLHAGQTHSQRILPLVRELLDEASLQLKQLDGIAFGAGPGSFTGLRIACGVAQGLAFGAGLPVVGVSTLLALAQATTADRVIACLDARMGEVYHAACVRDGTGWHEVLAPGLYAPEALPAVPGSDWVGAGSGWDSYADALQGAYATQLSEVLPGRYPSAQAIAELAAPQFAAGQGLPAAQAAPLYIRNKVALKTSERLQGGLPK